MNLVRKINLRLKVVATTTALIILPLIVLLILSQHFLEQRIERELEKTKQLKETVLENNFRMLSEKNIQLSAFASSLPEVRRAYEVFHQDTSQFADAYSALSLAFRRIDKSVSKDFGTNLRLQFSYPPNNILFRSWTNDPGNDFINFRKSFATINRDLKAVSALEIGRDGLKIRSIVPIFSDDSLPKLRGYVESDESYLKLLDRSKINQSEEYGVFLYSSILKSINKKGLISDPTRLGENNELINLSDSSMNIGDYSMIYTSSDNFYSKKIDSDQFRDEVMSVKNSFMLRTDTLQFIVNKIKDSSGAEIGLVVFQINMELGTEYLNKIKLSLYIIVIFTLILSVALFYMFSLWVMGLLRNLLSAITRTSEGEVVEELTTKTDDEISYFISSTNQLIRSFKSYVSFANELSKGELTSSFTTAGKNDQLGNALLELRSNMIASKEYEEKRAKEEAKVIWANEGRTFFVDILRESSKDLTELADKIIKGFVDYMGASQGGLFVLNNTANSEEPFLEMIACYAFNQKRFLERKINMGVGLVGMCAHEKLTYYRTDVPENYTSIRSALGFSNPKSLLIVPLKTDDKIFGVLELASLRTYEEHEIKFAEHIGENIASALYAARINARTNELLEQSRHQAEELAAQEIEMRYSMGILESAQEESNKTIQEASEKLRLFNEAFIIAEFDPKGILLKSNQYFNLMLKLLPSEIEGKHISMFFDEEEYEKIAFAYKKVMKGNILTDLDIQINTRMSFIWIRSSLLPCKDASGEVVKVILTATNIDQLNSRLKQQEQDLFVVDHSLFILNFDLKGKIMKVNEKVSNLLKTNVLEVANKADLFKFDDLQTSLSLWEILLEGESIYQTLDVFDFNNDVIRFAGLFYPVFDKHKRIDRIVYFASSFSKQETRPADIGL